MNGNPKSESESRNFGMKDHHAVFISILMDPLYTESVFDLKAFRISDFDISDLSLFLQTFNTAKFLFQIIIIRIGFLKQVLKSFDTAFLCHIEIVHNGRQDDILFYAT